MLVSNFIPTGRCTIRRDLALTRVRLERTRQEELYLISYTLETWLCISVPKLCAVLFTSTTSNGTIQGIVQSQTPRIFGMKIYTTKVGIATSQLKTVYLNVNRCA